MTSALPTTAVQTLTVTEDEAEIRLDRWFKRHFPTLSHGMLEKLLRTGQIRVEGKRAKSNQRLESGQQIRVPPFDASEAATTDDRPKIAKPVQVKDEDAAMLRDAILYQDEDVIVLNKPPGLAVQGGTGMKDRHLDAMLDALRFDKDERPKLVHRLDKDTSGVLILGRTAHAAAKLALAFRSRAARKCYWALVAGVPHPPMGRISAKLAKQPGHMGDKMEWDEEEGKHAVTYYRIIDHAHKVAAWLELEPHTGRTHQLRAHCVLLGTPIVGDGKYGGADALIAGQGVSRKLHLHARALKVPHPRGGFIEVTAPLPPHIKTSFAFFAFDEKDAGKPFVAFDME